MCKVWVRPCLDCRKEMMLSGSNTSEKHRGHREPCETYRRLKAEWGDILTMCDQEVAERWHSTGGIKKCAICTGATRERAKLRRATEHKARREAQKQELVNKKACQKYRNVAPAVSIEAAQAADYVNAGPPVQPYEPMIYQDRVVKWEAPTPRYGESQSNEAIASTTTAGAVAWEASQHEAAQPQPKEKEARVKTERSNGAVGMTSPGFEIEHHYSPSSPHDHFCSCGDTGHKIDIHFEASRKSDTLFENLFFDQYTTKAFEYDPTWRAACGAVMSEQEQRDVQRLFRCGRV